ncbi:MAG: hypothetical protein SGPRY_005125, partial [Prymnesium sp.]
MPALASIVNQHSARPADSSRASWPASHSILRREPAAVPDSTRQACSTFRGVTPQSGRSRTLRRSVGNVDYKPLAVRVSSVLRDFLGRIHDNIREVATQAGFMDLAEKFVMELALDIKTKAKQLKEQMLLKTSVIRSGAATPTYLRAPVLNSASSAHSVSFFTGSHELRYIAQMHLLSRFANVALRKRLSQNVGAWMDSKGHPIDGSVLHVSCPSEDSMLLPNMMGPPALVASVRFPTPPVTLDAIIIYIRGEADVMRVDHNRIDPTLTSEGSQPECLVSIQDVEGTECQGASLGSIQEKLEAQVGRNILLRCLW